MLQFKLSEPQKDKLKKKFVLRYIIVKLMETQHKEKNPDCI